MGSKQSKSSPVCLDKVIENGDRVKTSDDRTANVEDERGNRWYLRYENDGTGEWVSKKTVTLLEKRDDVMAEELQEEAQVMSNDSCQYANNGICNVPIVVSDSTNKDCDAWTDCTDCGNCDVPAMEIWYKSRQDESDYREMVIVIWKVAGSIAVVLIILGICLCCCRRYGRTPVGEADDLETGSDGEQDEAPATCGDMGKQPSGGDMGEQSPGGGMGQPGACIPSAPRMSDSSLRSEPTPEHGEPAPEERTGEQPSAPSLSGCTQEAREGEPTPPAQWSHNRVMRWFRDPKNVPSPGQDPLDVYRGFVNVVEIYQLDGMQLMRLSENMLAEMLPGKKSFEIMLLRNMLSKQFGVASEEGQRECQEEGQEEGQ